MTSLLSAPSAVLGVQEPRIFHAPPSVSSAGSEAIEVAALAGLILDPWECFVLDCALGERADGKWAAFEVGLAAPRQNGKGAILEARELAGAFAFGEKLLIHSAHEQLTSSEHFRRLLNLIEGVPEFDQRVLKVVRGKGSEAIELRGGQRIFFKTRTGGGGRGLTGDFVALDEAMILPVATTAALVPTMAARSIVGNPQLMYSGSAVDQEKHEHGLVFARVRERGLRGDSRVAWFEWSAEGDDPGRVPDDVRSDPESWARANPGLGIRISLDHIANECGGALGPREFAVERLGIGDWPDTSEDGGRVISAEVWAACAEHDETKCITSAYVYAIDVNPDRTWSSIGVAGTRDDGLYQVAVVEHRRGTDWVAARCAELLKTDGSQLIVDARSYAASLVDTELADAGVFPMLASTEDYGNAFGTFVDDVTDLRVRYPAPQPELDDALGSARRQSLGDRWKWARRSPTSSDITPLVAVTLALWGAHTQGSPQVWALSEMVAQLQGEPVPAVAAAEPQPSGQRFVPLSQTPVQRGVFRR